MRKPKGNLTRIRDFLLFLGVDCLDKFVKGSTEGSPFMSLSVERCQISLNSIRGSLSSQFLLLL